tara:strand:- start:2727 stop:3554 length:828 start_codon:yes stop_codon:yes gene_type:complete
MMKKFKSHSNDYDRVITEMAAVNLTDMNSEFLKRAQRVTSFNLATKDFEALTYKNEIQWLFKTHLFPKFDLNKTLKKFNVDAFNNLIEKLRSENRQGLNHLHFYNLKGVGPGEATMFFLVDALHLGGGGSAGVDAIIGGKKYEIKAANYSKATKTVIGFKLGGTVPLGDLVNKAKDMKEKLGFKTKGKGESEVNTTQIAAIKRKFPREWNAIEKAYVNRAFKYFGSHETIFMNNNKSGSKLTGEGGRIIAVKKIAKSDIAIHTITQGTIKPRVKI